jgi:hypothetical protein
LDRWPPISTSVVSSSNFTGLSSGLRLVLLFDSVRGVAVMGGRVQGILVRLSPMS